MQNRKRTELSELGEFSLIERLTEAVALTNPSSLEGVGDDAALIRYGTNRISVVTTDLLLEGIHFDLVYTPLKHLGYKAVVVNLSDVYAMNATPRQVTVSVGISRRLSLEDMEELYSGIHLACQLYGVDLVGGDTSTSLTGLTISVTALGEADEEKIAYRRGARIHDLICVTGNLGAAYMGLQLLEREKKVLSGSTEGKPHLEGYSYLLERVLKPEARKSIIEEFAQNNLVPTSLIDISDGLSSELLHICKQSDVGCRIYLDKIPIDQETFKLCEEMNISPMVAALNGGEDYELLFTVPMDKLDTISGIDGISIIGHIVEKEMGTNYIPSEGDEIPITAQGWQAIKR